MDTDRRHFSTAMLLATAGGAALPLAAAAQAFPVEGTHYVRLSSPVPGSGSGKFDVIEFFWYGCPHCHSFEPTLEAWQKTLAPDVSFRRVPVAFSPEPFVAHQRIFYALEALDLLNTLHRKVFYAIHSERMRLTTPAEIGALMTKNGVDATKFFEAYESFSVQTKAAQARQLAQAYKIDAVPALGIHGRFYVTGSMAGGNDRMPLVADALLQRLRKGPG